MANITTNNPDGSQATKLDEYSGSRYFKCGGEINVENNYYPSYIIRDIYTQDGFDFLILTEDNLTKLIIEKILNKNELRDGKLIHVVPVGGWQNVLALHKDILSNNIVGIGTTVISVLDGDIDDTTINKKYQDLKKLKIPVQSIEKFLFEKCVLTPDKTIKNELTINILH